MRRRRPLGSWSLGIWRGLLWVLAGCGGARAGLRFGGSEAGPGQPLSAGRLEAAGW
jgi:hypothetical protein